MELPPGSMPELPPRHQDHRRTKSFKFQRIRKSWQLSPRRQELRHTARNYTTAPGATARRQNHSDSTLSTPTLAHSTAALATLFGTASSDDHAH